MKPKDTSCDGQILDAVAECLLAYVPQTPAAIMGIYTPIAQFSHGSPPLGSGVVSGFLFDLVTDS